MRIAYIVNARMPTERAHGTQTARMCEAFVALGQSVTLYHPYRLFNRLRRHDLFQFFSVEHRFDVKTLAHADLLPLVRRLPTGKLGNGLLLLDAMLFGRTAVKRAGRAACDVIYTRDWEVAWCAVRRHLPTVYESHFLPPSLRLRHVIGNMARQAQTRLVVAITSGVEDDLVESGVPREKIVVAPDAVDLRQYQSDPGREAARARLGLDPKRPTAVYTGSLFRYKGVHVVAEAAGALPEVLFLIVGGSPGDIAALRKDVRERGLGNVNVWGSVPPGEVAWFQAAADVLLLPNTSEGRLSTHYTSPLKMYEYMAAGRPIVASDLPSLREELVDGATAFFVRPGDAPSLARAVERLLTERELSERLAHTALQQVQDKTWDRRALRIMDALTAVSVGFA